MQYRKTDCISDQTGYCVLGGAGKTSSVYCLKHDQRDYANPDGRSPIFVSWLR